ncbi:iron-siderophore ABC transporter substrate-binding protein [Paracoccus shanxieyensis]|uniref:ABC transporter substrate-binding protein n=1 Tax=Paracoccus shanxieyensis TaxID=2675752 RepID=A0A6L6IUQ6_9RHOB|nr:iron-siderophore ABC transporter substrate-binding protein [Paracoccus shanxieyensis]MTH64245.1 ABC transporter substrate-binding protein [Paracoccus shanxieyensis]MTH87389.1 ABC transporter substrate-binding protein [Paracoccus shanxieyensis]
MRLRISATLAAISLAVVLAVPARADQPGYPMTITHALGTTTIPAKPVRVAAVSWANQEVPLALGIVPVGFARANFGDDDGDGLLPWVSQKLKELGAETPVLFDEGDGIDFEAVAATQPDVILAAYSGLTQAEYDTLSQIAPVIAYPDSAWATDWRDTIRLNSAGLGMAAQGDALIASIDAQIAETVARHPELHDKSAMFITHLDTTDLSRVNFYTANDTRVKFFADLGLTAPKSVQEATRPGQFSGGISAERIDAFDDVDIVVTYGGQPLWEAIKADPLMAHMPAVQHGSLVMLGSDPLGTAANPTPLSIPYVLEDYVDLLAGAARKADGQ